MTTPELLSLMRLLSAMESAMLTVGKSLPDHLLDEVTRHVQILEREILQRAARFAERAHGITKGGQHD